MVKYLFFSVIFCTAGIFHCGNKFTKPVLHVVIEHIKRDYTDILKDQHDEITADNHFVDDEHFLHTVGFYRTTTPKVLAAYKKQEKILKVDSTDEKALEQIKELRSKIKALIADGYFILSHIKRD